MCYHNILRWSASSAETCMYIKASNNRNYVSKDPAALPAASGGFLAASKSNVRNSITKGAVLCWCCVDRVGYDRFTTCTVCNCVVFIILHFQWPDSPEINHIKQIWGECYTTFEVNWQHITQTKYVLDVILNYLNATSNHSSTLGLMLLIHNQGHRGWSHPSSHHVRAELPGSVTSPLQHTHTIDSHLHY